jgi:hypothetical protein
MFKTSQYHICWVVRVVITKIVQVKPVFYHVRSCGSEHDRATAPGDSLRSGSIGQRSNGLHHHGNRGRLPTDHYCSNQNSPRAGFIWTIFGKRGNPFMPLMFQCALRGGTELYDAWGPQIQAPCCLLVIAITDVPMAPRVTGTSLSLHGL